MNSFGNSTVVCCGKPLHDSRKRGIYIEDRFKSRDIYRRKIQKERFIYTKKGVLSSVNEFVQNSKELDNKTI